MTTLTHDCPADAAPATGDHGPRLDNLSHIPEFRNEEEAALRAAAGHPVLVECQRTADAFTAYADAHPGEDTDLWAFEAVERVMNAAFQIADNAPQAELDAIAVAARGQRAALTCGLLDDEGPMTADRLAALDRETVELLAEYAHPWPIRWLFPPEQDADGTIDRPRCVQLFNGPGGWSTGIRDVLHVDVDMVGVDLDAGVVATATAAGFEVIHASVTDLDPEHPALQYVTGIILSPPCQAFSPSGLRLGRYADAIDLIVEAIREVGALSGFRVLADHPHLPAGVSIWHEDWIWDDIRAPLEALADPRAGLMLEVVIWPLAMLARGGSVEWVAVEQSSALPQEIEQALFAELTVGGLKTIEAETLDAVDYGAASRRRRRILTAYRTTTPYVDVRPAEPLPTTTFAQCVGWAPGRRVNTRGQRGTDPVTGKPKGGNVFSADQPSTCITATVYGWRDDETGEHISQADIGRLVGFPTEYPWQHVGRGKGIRNKAQQAADAVCPMVAAAVIGRVLSQHWEDSARAYVEELYRPAATLTAVLTILPQRVAPALMDALFEIEPNPATPTRSAA
jgi:site-specific DNA-cytosine methylase